MPVYEYGCSKCGSKFEKLVKITDNSVQECPKCGSKDVKRVFSTFGIGGCPNTGAGGYSKGHSCSNNKAI